MSVVQRRIKNVIAKIGDPFTIGVTSHVGVFVPISPGRAATYLPQTQIDPAPRPIRIVYLPFDDSAAVDDVVSWDSRTLTVKQVINARFRGETVARLAVLT